MVTQDNKNSLRVPPTGTQSRKIIKMAQTNIQTRQAIPTLHAQSRRLTEIQRRYSMSGLSTFRCPVPAQMHTWTMYGRS